MYQRFLFLVLQIMFSLLVISPSTFAESSNFLQAKPGCQSKCGNVAIPYPFGIGDGCFIDQAVGGRYADEYNLLCNNSYDPPKLFPGNKGTVEILSISEIEIRVQTTKAYLCYNESGHQIDQDRYDGDLDLVKSMFTASYKKNMFFGIGCDIIATTIGLSGDNETATSTNSCISKCKSSKSMIAGTCSGTNGCCQIIVPKGLKRVSAALEGVLQENPPISSYSSCNFAFLAEVGKFTIEASDLRLNGSLHKGTKWTLSSYFAVLKSDSGQNSLETGRTVHIQDECKVSLLNNVQVSV
ncbi:hypothetical protein MKW98_018218 [Papaver atlanticum]|uniref:Wall-associated receptor kinase galacturonan-binding domain-containing protein n=1 Tax=Papaver atlanticum TaxID=357466 RepID=A0AAD4RVA3_9MAGN|nr:hypothetical protein MKW98_018218 [Papaver atlanticum]